VTPDATIPCEISSTCELRHILNLLLMLLQRAYGGADLLDNHRRSISATYVQRVSVCEDLVVEIRAPWSGPGH
jgi:hypothetical protein